MPALLEIENRLWKKGMCVAGIDEVGRGPLSGPVVACAIILPKNFPTEGINDSKKLTSLQREKLFPIIQKYAISIGIGIISNKIIDRVNILQATAQAMFIAVKRLSVAPNWLLVDGNNLPDLPYPGEAIVKGDAKSISIAAASIIAKVTRDRLMNYFAYLYPQYGFAKHKGYGTSDHINALKVYGPCPIHRRSFSPIRNYFSSQISFL